MVITGLTRNQLYSNVPWVRIPPAPPFFILQSNMKYKQVKKRYKPALYRAFFLPLLVTQKNIKLLKFAPLLPFFYFAPFFKINKKDFSLEFLSNSHYFPIVYHTTKHIIAPAIFLCLSRCFIFHHSSCSYFLYPFIDSPFQ